MENDDTPAEIHAAVLDFTYSLDLLETFIFANLSIAVAEPPFAQPQMEVNKKILACFLVLGFNFCNTILRSVCQDLPIRSNHVTCC